MNSKVTKFHSFSFIVITLFGFKAHRDVTKMNNWMLNLPMNEAEWKWRKKNITKRAYNLLEHTTMSWFIYTQFYFVTLSYWMNSASLWILLVMTPLPHYTSYLFRLFIRQQGIEHSTKYVIDLFFIMLKNYLLYVCVSTQFRYKAKP